VLIDVEGVAYALECHQQMAVVYKIVQSPIVTGTDFDEV
jgi:hypothetical protein